MNKATMEWGKAGIVLLLAILLYHANDRNTTLKQENETLKAELKDNPAPDEWRDTRIMFHVIASENYKLNGQAKRWLPPGMVIRDEDRDYFLQNGWAHRPKD